MEPIKNTSAFTLVELLIVISIIWLLVIGLFPRLLWAQERSRDTGRITSIKSTAGVLETFYTNKWAYPTSPSNTSSMNQFWDGCLSQWDGTVHADLANMFKWFKAPLDTFKKSISQPCNLNRVMWYSVIKKNNVENAWFALSVDMESYKNANCDWSSISSPCSFYYDGMNEYKDIKISPVWFLNWETSFARDSIYVEKN